MPTVSVRVPVRVLDAGGWTDTWFAARGTVCNLAVEDGIEVVARLHSPRDGVRADTVELHLASFGDRYRFSFGDPVPRRHPLLEATICRWAPRGARLSVAVTSSVPPGSGLGTSASVVVGLIVSLQALSGEVSDPATVARAAHDVETVDLGLQSGIQDQIAACYGGATLIEIDRYPMAEAHPLALAPATWQALERQMLTVYLGKSRRSSTVHEAVIARLTTTDSEALLAPLRIAAHRAATALVTGDIEEYGAAMIANTEAQAGLHPALVNPSAREVIEMARRYGAQGWKLNGAGGTVTIISPPEPARLTEALGTLDGLTVLPLRPARQGVRIVEA
jgi:D-glycero-alpha-D-manno-heptose-7-phosphate kinase